MTKRRTQSVCGAVPSPLDRELQGTWLVTAEEYSIPSPQPSIGEEYTIPAAWWNFKKGKAVYVDCDIALRMDYSYRMHGDLLSLYPTDEDTARSEPEQYRVVISGKEATFRPEGEGTEGYVTCIHLTKL